MISNKLNEGEGQDRVRKNGVHCITRKFRVASVTADKLKRVLTTQKAIKDTRMKKFRSFSQRKPLEAFPLFQPAKLVNQGKLASSPPTAPQKKTHPPLQALAQPIYPDIAFRPDSIKG